MSHNCEGYTLRATVGMYAEDYKTRVVQVTEEHQYDLQQCKIDSKKRVICAFNIPSGETHALGMLMHPKWRPFLKYKYSWVQNEV